jgi:hypothetical protein
LGTGYFDLSPYPVPYPSFILAEWRGVWIEGDKKALINRALLYLKRCMAIDEEA